MFCTSFIMAYIDIRSGASAVVTDGFMSPILATLIETLDLFLNLDFLLSLLGGEVATATTLCRTALAVRLLPLAPASRTPPWSCCPAAYPGCTKASRKTTTLSPFLKEEEKNEDNIKENYKFQRVKKNKKIFCKKNFFLF